MLTELVSAAHAAGLPTLSWTLLAPPPAPSQLCGEEEGEELGHPWWVCTLSVCATISWVGSLPRAANFLSQHQNDDFGFFLCLLPLCPSPLTRSPSATCFHSCCSFSHLSQLQFSYNQAPNHLCAHQISWCSWLKLLVQPKLCPFRRLYIIWLRFLRSLFLCFAYWPR